MAGSRSPLTLTYTMANGRVVACSTLTYLAVAAIALNLGWKTRQCMNFNTRISVTGKGRGLSLFWEKFRPTLPSFGLNSRRHLGFRSLLKSGFLRCRVNRYPNSVSTFQLTRLLISWDVHFNPGPLANKPSCQICQRTIDRNHRLLYCETCGFQYHIKCGKVTPKQFVEISRDNISPWKCPACLQQFVLD